MIGSSLAIPLAAAPAAVGPPAAAGAPHWRSNMLEIDEKLLFS
jgi:hypothetical protein